jgi:hypothetical protein
LLQEGDLVMDIPPLFRMFACSLNSNTNLSLSLSLSHRPDKVEQQSAKNERKGDFSPCVSRRSVLTSNGSEDSNEGNEDPEDDSQL